MKNGYLKPGFTLSYWSKAWNEQVFIWFQGCKATQADTLYGNAEYLEKKIEKLGGRFKEK